MAGIFFAETIEKPSSRRFWWLPVLFISLKGYLSFLSSMIGDSVSLHLKFAVLRGEMGENPWLFAKLYDITISWHTWLESCSFPGHFGTRVVGGLSLYLVTRIFSTSWDKILTEVLEGLICISLTSLYFVYHHLSSANPCSPDGRESTGAAGGEAAVHLNSPNYLPSFILALLHPSLSISSLLLVSFPAPCTLP